MKIKNLWQNYQFPVCDNCKKECQGHLNYKNLCANLNYLLEYAEKNYEKNKESFKELKRYIGNIKPNIFSFGCGLGFDYIGATEIFGQNITYFGVDENDWAIKKTENYKKFKPKLPKTINFEEGIFLLNAMQENVVICFFNSLFTILNNTNLEKELVNALQNKRTFYLVCNYTINKNFHMPKEELNFLNKLLEKLNGIFKFKCFEILDGKGIIVCGEIK